MMTNDLQKLKTDLKQIQEKMTICCDDHERLVAEMKVISDQIKSRKQLNTKFNSIVQEIRLTNATKCKEVIEIILPQVIEKMRLANSLFGKMYKCNVYTGSYYDKLRIKDACEFDINLVLSLPVKVKPSPSPHSTVQLSETPESLRLTEKEISQLKSILDSEGYVLPKKLLDWIQSIMDKADLKEIQMNQVKEIHFTASGPAKTLLIELNDMEGTTISVDLVPVFRFPFQEWPRQLKKLRQNFVQKTIHEKQNLYLVPKCYKPGLKQSPHEPAKINIPRIWRMHFADIEQSVLEQHCHSRPVIKLLKLLRDSQKWSNLHSYFLKTLVLNEIARNPKKQWRPDSLAEDVLQMMDSLKKCFRNKKLPHLFFPSVNLLQYISPKEIDNMNSRLSTIRKYICSNPEKTSTYFVV